MQLTGLSWYGNLFSVYTGGAETRASDSLFFTYTNPDVIHTGIHGVLIINLRGESEIGNNLF